MHEVICDEIKKFLRIFMWAKHFRRNLKFLLKTF